MREYGGSVSGCKGTKRDDTDLHAEVLDALNPRRLESLHTVRTHLQENGGAAFAVGVGIGIAVAIAIGACGKASLNRLSHDR